jgi:periplasmic divalent cation tolerance protein
MDKYCIIITTLAKKSEAEILAKKIVENRLAACVQIQKIESCYRWNEEVCQDDEYLLYIKTESRLYDDIEKFIKKHHNYEIPEIVKIPITDGYRDYFKWINESIEVK